MRAALIIAPTAVVIATGYSWWRWHKRERRGARSGEAMSTTMTIDAAVDAALR
jgi:hypothetical protein